MHFLFQMSVLVAQQDEAIDIIQATGVDVEANTRIGYVPVPVDSQLPH